VGIKQFFGVFFKKFDNNLLDLFKFSMYINMFYVCLFINGIIKIMDRTQFPKIMGILNVTPDSFSDGGKFFSEDKAVAQGLKLLDDGADILDIGGESTRPGADSVSEDDELKRVIPVIMKIKKMRPKAVISIDSTKYNVARESVEAGATMINDISGLDNDIRLAELAARQNLGLIIMHIQGKPRTMQDNPIYDNVVNDVFNILKEKIEKAKDIGVQSIIADAGIGFGKTYEHNIALLKNYSNFHALGVPLMIGLSRKAFIGKMLDISDPSQRDIPTVLIHSLLLNKNIDIIRVHNVQLLMMLKKIYQSII
jgi:dihydropteroate synthase